MNNQQLIIDNILKEAQDKADNIIQQAQKEAQNNIKMANSKAEEIKKAKFPDRNAYIDELVDRAKVMSDIDARKIITAKKASIIDDVFKLVEADLKSKKYEYDYINIIQTMIIKYAESGDTITFSSKDKQLFNKKFLSELANEIGKKLIFNETYGSFSGGIIISNKSYDKNLTLEMEFATLREEIDGEIYKKIFLNKKEGI